MAIKLFIFQVEAFQYSKFHENVGRIDKGNFKNDLIMTINVENSQKIFMNRAWLDRESLYCELAQHT